VELERATAAKRGWGGRSTKDRRRAEHAVVVAMFASNIHRLRMLGEMRDVTIERSSRWAAA